MIAKICLSLVTMICVAAVAAQAAEPPPPPPSANSEKGLDNLRAAVKDAYNRGDVDKLVSYIHPDCVIVFPGGALLKGPEGLREYYHRMLKAPGHRVESFNADPQIATRTVHNDVGLSYGKMNDQYVLNDGMRFSLNSQFTITVFKSPDGPKDTDGWMIRSFHASADVFENEVLTLITKRVTWMAGGGGLAVGLLVGLIAGALLWRRKK